MAELYAPKDYSGLLGIEGLSDELLKNHFTLYEGYVKNTNALMEKLSGMDASTPEAAELKRRFGWEWNGMRLHEYYFGNMSKSPAALGEDAPLAGKLAASFGSVEEWRKNFIAVGSMRGIGWVVLYEDTETGALLNVWINEHDLGHLAGGRILLIMDVFEHAFMLDYGIKRADYIETFMRSIDWTEVERRYSLGK